MILLGTLSIMKHISSFFSWFVLIVALTTNVQHATAQDGGEHHHRSFLRGDVLEIDLREPGTLDSYINDDEEKQVRCIRLNGSINGDDIRVIKRICDRSNARDAQGRTVDNYLDLELDRARIVGGGKNYSTKTEHDAIGRGMFRYSRCLRYVSLPRSIKIVADEAFEGCSKLEEVKFPGRCDVRYIGEEAFRGCSRLSRINLPEGISEIRERCFYECSDLRSIQLPQSLTFIGKEAFCDSQLTRINLPYGLSSLGADAFKGTQLTQLLIPAATSIENDAPGHMPKLREFQVEMGSRFYSAHDGVLYDYSGVRLIAFPPASKGFFAVPNGVEAIADNAFKQCENVTGVTLPQSLSSIGSHAFEQCGALQNIEIPSSVTYIGTKAFANCKKLATASIDAAIAILPERAFENCTSLKSIALANELRTIGESAFEDCRELMAIDGANGLTAIGKNAFKKCGFEEIILPPMVRSLADNAFRDCKSLKSIVLPQGLTAVPKEMMRGCDKLTSVVFPSTLTTIGENALRDCKSLATIEIPEGVTTIDNNAFRGTAITALTLPSTIQNIGEKIVEKCKMQSITCLATTPPELKKISEKKTTLFVPATAVEAYKSTKQWKDFKNILPLE